MKKYVYILRSLSFPIQIYTGVSLDPERRLREHNSGKSVYTNKYKPWELVAYICFENPRKADSFERYLKTGSGRAFIQRHFLS